MKVEEQIFYRVGNRQFNSRAEAESFIINEEERSRRSDDFVREVLKERDQLCQDIENAYKSAFYGGIIDTMSNPHYRALFYMKNVCDRFVRKHEAVKMV